MSATTSTPEAAKRGIFGKSKEAPKAADRSSTAYRREKVYVPEARERDTTFSLRKTSEKVLADSLTEFISVLENPTVAAPTALEPWQTQLLDTFRSSVGAYKPDELTGKVAEFMKSEQGVVMALKVMEWEQLTIQEATKTKITINKRPKVKGVGIRPFQRGFTSGGGQQNTPDTYIHEPDEFKTTVEFTDLQAVTVGRLNTQLTYDVGGLSQAQRAYLERTGKTRTFATGNDAKTERGNIADRLMQMTRARVDFYQQTGFGGVEPNIFKDQPTHLLAERGATPAATAKERLVNQIDVVRSKLEVEATEKVAKAKETEKKEQTKTVVDDIAARLEKGAPPLSEADIKKQKQLDKEITEATTKKTELEAAIAQGKLIPDQIKARDEAVAKIPAGIHAKLKKINGGYTASGKPAAGSLIEAKQAQINFEVARDTAKTNLEEAGKRLAEVREMVARIDAAGGVVGPTLLAELATVQGDYSTARVSFQTAQSNLGDQQRVIQEMTDLQQQYNAEWEAIKNANSTLDDMVDAYKKAGTKYGIVGSFPLVAGIGNFGIPGLELQDADIIPVVAATEATIKTKTADKAKLENPQEIERTHKKVCYSELKKLLDGDNVDTIQNRARNHDLNHPELVVDAALYGDYPPVYLRGMQILFGDDIVRSGRRDEFVAASTLISPERFWAVVGPELQATDPMYAGLPIADIYNDALKNPDLLTRLTGNMARNLLDATVQEGKAGTLGTLSPAEVALRESIVSTAATDISAVPPADVDAIMGVFMHPQHGFYHYENADDLTARIHAWRAGLPPPGNIVMGGVSITTTADEKAYALEIDRRRKARI